VLQANGFLNTEREVLEVKVEPGWKQGTKVTFPRRGDVFPGRLPADIVFLIKETEHPTFRRDGADLKSVNLSIFPVCIRLNIIFVIFGLEKRMSWSSSM
jgi:DnaJ-class molecular chaperone